MPVMVRPLAPADYARQQLEMTFPSWSLGRPLLAMPFRLVQPPRNGDYRNDRNIVITIAASERCVEFAELPSRSLLVARVDALGQRGVAASGYTEQRNLLGSLKS